MSTPGRLGAAFGSSLPPQHRVASRDTRLDVQLERETIWSAELEQGVPRGRLRQPRQVLLRQLRPPVDLGAGAGQRRMRTHQSECLAQLVRGRDLAPDQFPQPVIARIGAGFDQQRRQRRDALAQVRARSLAGGVTGDVDDVVAELEHHADLFTERSQFPQHRRRRAAHHAAEDR